MMFHKGLPRAVLCHSVRTCTLRVPCSCSVRLTIWCICDWCFIFPTRLLESGNICLLTYQYLWRAFFFDGFASLLDPRGLPLALRKHWRALLQNGYIGPFVLSCRNSNCLVFFLSACCNCQTQVLPAFLMSRLMFCAFSLSGLLTLTFSAGSQLTARCYPLALGTLTSLARSLSHSF